MKNNKRGKRNIRNNKKRKNRKEIIKRKKVRDALVYELFTKDNNILYQVYNDHLWKILRSIFESFILNWHLKEKKSSIKKKRIIEEKHEKISHL